MNNKFKKTVAGILLALSLSNNAQAIVAERIDTDVSAFNGNLSASDDNVQDALNTIDNIVLSGFVPYSGATTNVNLGTYTLTSSAVTATAAASGPKIFAYNSSGGGSSLSLGAGSSLSYLQFPSSKVFMLAPVSDITASPSSGDAKLAVDSTTVYIGAYGTLNSEELIVWGDIAIGDNGTNNAQALRFYEPSSSGSNYTGFKAQAQSANVTYTLPSSSSTGYLSNVSGALSWSAFTQGSVPFASSTTLLTEDNKNFRYDDTNDRLSVFNTLGSELVSNGNFTSNATSWTVSSGMAWSSGAVVKSSNGTGALTQAISPSKITSEYLLTYTISNWTVGTVTPSYGGWTGTAVSANGTYTERFVATTSTSSLSFTPSNTARFTIDTISMKLLKGTNTLWNLGTGGLNIQAEWSNGTPGTTRAMTFNNEGSYTWTDYRFAGTLRGSYGVNSSGGHDMYASGGNYFAYYSGNSGLTSNSLFSYNYPTAFVHYGGGWFTGGVHAGAGYAPTSTLQTAGGLALQVKRITASQTLDNTAVHWLCDATTAAACTGTPSNACSTHGSEGACIANDAHGGCSWNAGNSCSAFNYESGMGTCSGTSGCSVDTVSCSGPTDEYSCTSQDDSYGGGCSWDGTDCSGLPDEGTCSSYSGSGCTTNYSDCSTYNDNYSSCTGQSGCSSSSAEDCSTYDGTDQGTCEAISGCYWDGMSNCYMTCSGSYYTGCTGTYYNCNGNYNNGSCSGTYGSGCTGSVSCSVINDSTSCGAETGCTWSAVLNATLPAMATYPHRTYWVQNDASGGADTVLIPQSGETVNGASSYTIAHYQDGVHIAPYHDLRSCSEFVTLGACTPDGCTPSNTACSWDGMTDCSGDSACDSADNTDSMTCNAITYFTSCSGQYTVTKDWHVWTVNNQASGTYTPTLTNTTNIGASTARLATYMRVGSTVTVSGQLDIDPTSTGAVLLGISLPIASDFSTAYQLGGAGSTIAITNESYGIEADSTNNRASMKNIAVSTANHTVTYTFTYQLV